MDEQKKQECCSTHSYHPIKKVKGIFIIILVIAIVAYLGVLIRNEIKEFYYIGQTAETKNEITIDGTGEAVAVPDIAKVNIGVWTEKATVAEAQKENTEKMNKIIKAIKDLKIDDKDIKTTNYNIYPQYDWTEDGQKLRGYQVSQSIDVKIRDLEKSSQVIQTATTNGANQVGDLRFEVDDLELIKQAARTQAIEDAQKKADEIADQLNVKLGRVINFYESAPVSPAYRDYATLEGLGGGGEIKAPTIEPGESEIKINVSITFELL